MSLTLMVGGACFITSVPPRGSGWVSGASAIWNKSSTRLFSTRLDTGREPTRYREVVLTS